MISISIPPFPDFIEGNYKIMRKGQSHVERKNLGFFDLIAVKKGALFLAEGEKQYEVKENEMFILLPDRHHYSWKPCQEDTGFYWLHFYTTAQWKQGPKASRFVSKLPISGQHYHQCSYTLHLQKYSTIMDDFIFIVESQAIFVVKFGSLIKQINNFKIKNLYISSYIDICFSKENEQDENNKEIVEDRRKVLELKNISFAYGEKKVIENLSFSIGLGEKIAIFGENGSGKSTLVKLLLGLLTPDKGEICYCNSEIGVIFQDFGKYSFSVKENISLNREFSDKDIFEALFSFGGNNILTGLPNSIYTNIGVEYYNDGVDFSGGQWQKLALARGMIGENMLYILDEPFSALDALAEKVQYDLLFSNYRFESFVIVSHQMGLANMVDKVILLENGKIIAYGVHNELMKNCKKYRQMYETQSKYYEN